MQSMQTNVPDVTGSTSIVGANTTLRRYGLQENVYIINAMDYAHNVEYGYPERPDFGWSEKEGYHFLSESVQPSVDVLRMVANKLRE